MSQLALLGGAPLMATGPPGWPPQIPAVLQQLQQLYNSGDWGRYDGAATQQLVERLSDLHGQTHVHLCCSGTLAVELGLRALGVTADHEVLLAGYDFPGNFRAIEAIGARPVLLGLQQHCWNLNPAQLDAALSVRTKAVIVSHLHGCVPDLPRIKDWAAQHDVAVLEDACQAVGGLVVGRPAGGWGDVGVLSFGGSKLLTAGRGGAVLTHDPRLAQRLQILNDRGNLAYPLSQLQAAVLLPQLATLEEQSHRRAEAARQVKDWVEQHSRLLAAPQDPALRQDPRVTRPGLYKLGLRLHDQLHSPNERPLDRQLLLQAYQAEGLAIDAGFRGFHLRSERRCGRVGELPQARQAATGTLLLHHPVLLEPASTITRVIAVFEKVERAYAELRALQH